MLSYIFYVFLTYFVFDFVVGCAEKGIERKLSLLCCRVCSITCRGYMDLKSGLYGWQSISGDLSAVVEVNKKKKKV